MTAAELVIPLQSGIVRPRLRGWLHVWAFGLSIVAGGVLVAVTAAAHGPRGALATSVYAGTVSLLFGTSALYHRVAWRPPWHTLMARLDHSMIFLFIAGTYTPFALLVLDGDLATVILVVVWAGALAGIFMKLVWIDAPKTLVAILYLALGWVAVAAFPTMLEELGITGTALVVVGGLLYTAGALVYAFQRPNPAPTVFGYHEVFHALVILAAALQYGVIAFHVIPGS